MKNKKAASPRAAKLRCLAERRLKEQQTEVAQRGTEPDALRLVHELQVHQVELEMQNQELVSVRGEVEAGLERYTDLYDFAPVGYFTLDRDGNICRANIMGASLLGIERARLVRRKFGGFVAPAESDRWGRYLRSLSPSAGKQTCELAFQRADGSQFHARLESIRLQEAHSGDPSLVIRVAMSDITERKQAEDAMIASEARYRSYVEVTGQLGWTTNAAGEVVEDLPAWRRFTGQTPPEIQGWGWSKALHPDDVPRATEVWRQAVADRQNYEVEYRIRRHDGIYRDFLARSIPLLNDNGSIREWVGTCIDITARKQAEDQIKASLAEKEVFLREIHHRVKNNLQIISSLVSLQADSLADEQSREVFRDVRDRVHTMALVHEKLYQTGALAQVNFADYAASLLQYLWRAHGAAAANVRLELAVAPVPLPVEAAMQCGLILNELAGNALKHAFPNRDTGTVTVGLEHDPATGAVCLRVRDNGVGLPLDADWRQSRTLGLRLVQMLAGQLRGTLETGPGPGTEFRVICTLQCPMTND